MSNMADTSLAAFKRANVTAGQQRIIDFLRARPKLRPTRQEIADISGMKLQSVCGRVNELIYDFGDTPWIRELPARDGAHPLELIEVEFCAQEVKKKPSPVWVKPVFEHHRMSMPLANAKAIAGHPRRELIPAALLAEADAVVMRGAHWVAL